MIFAEYTDLNGYYRHLEQNTCKMQPILNPRTCPRPQLPLSVDGIIALVLPRGRTRWEVVFASILFLTLTTHNQEIVRAEPPHVFQTYTLFSTATACALGHGHWTGYTASSPTCLPFLPPQFILPGLYFSKYRSESITPVLRMSPLR